MSETVTAIIEKNFKTGTSAKTGKDWSLHKYKSGEREFTSFDDLEIGDVVKLEQTEYGWTGRKPKVTDTQHDEVMSALRLLMAEVKKLTSE